MIWSKKLKLFENHLAEPLKGRLKIHSAGYRNAYEERGRSWIEIDRVEVASFCDFKFENEWKKAGFDRKKVEAKGIYSKSDFGIALGKFLNLKIEKSLESDCDLIRALAFLDRRIGKRKLQKAANENLGTVSQVMYRIRLELESEEVT